MQSSDLESSSSNGLLESGSLLLVKGEDEDSKRDVLRSSGVGSRMRSEEGEQTRILVSGGVENLDV